MQSAQFLLRERSTIEDRAKVAPHARRLFRRVKEAHPLQTALQTLEEVEQTCLVRRTTAAKVKLARRCRVTRLVPFIRQQQDRLSEIEGGEGRVQGNLNSDITECDLVVEIGRASCRERVKREV